MWVICPQCWDAWQDDVGALCSSCGVAAVPTPLFPREGVREAYTSLEPGFDWLSDTKGFTLICPKDKTKITAKHYDAEYEWYECPKCGGAYTADELEEAENGTSPLKRQLLAQKKKVVAKGKKRRTEILDDEKALEEFEKEAMTPRESAEPQAKRHRDDVSAVEVRNIMADEIEAIGEEMGIKIDRLNAVEFYAWNFWLALHVKNGVSAREQEVPMVYCADHAA